MRIEIDLLTCKDFGECVLSAPHVFRMDESGKQSLRNGATGNIIIVETTNQYRDQVEEAVIVCPMQALTLL